MTTMSYERFLTYATSRQLPCGGPAAAHAAPTHVGAERTAAPYQVSAVEMKRS